MRQLRAGRPYRPLLLETRSLKAGVAEGTSPAILNRPMATAAIPLELQKRIEAVICGTLEPVSPLPPNPVLVARLFVLSGACIQFGVWWLGGAGWRALSNGQAATIFSFLTFGMLLLADTASRLMVPGSRQRVCPLLTTFSPLLALLFAIFLVLPYKWNPDFVTVGLGCFQRGLLCAAIPAPLIAFILRRSALLSPLWQGAAAGLLSGFTGLTVVEINCPYLDRAHVLVWHCGSALIVMFAGIVIAVVSARFQYGTLRHHGLRH